MRATTRISLFAILCALAVIASACGGSSSDSVTETGAPSADQPSESVTGTSNNVVSESPLGELLGIPLGNGEDADQYFAERTRQAEISTAECMLAQGFQYQVLDYSELDSLGANVDFDSREFAEQYGFGITSDPFEESFEALESFDDPNHQYVESLTDGERDAYYAALTGELPVVDRDDPNSGDFDAFEPAGCQGEAFDEAFAFDQIFDQFDDAFDELDELYEADPRIVEANSGWGACMTEAGFLFSDESGARDDIQRRYDTIVQSPDAFEEVEVPTDLADGEDFFVYGPQSLRPEAQAKVDELAAEERSIALAAWDCSAPVRAIQDEVWLELEQRFVDQNGAAIQAALDG